MPATVMRIINNLFIISVVLVCLYSCDKQRVYDEYKSFDGSWHKDSIASFEFEQQDTITPYNLFITVRNNSKYPYSNLFLIVEMQQPESNIIKVDTLEYEMANPDGTLMGEGFASVKESKLWYKEKVKFPVPGSYKINIQQAMREQGKVPGIKQLEGITEVGFRIETIE